MVLITGAAPGVVAVPVTVIVEVLATVPGATVSVSVVEQVGLHEPDENPAVTPAGSAESEKVTACVTPACSAAVMIVDPGAPQAVTLTAVGFAVSEKLKAGITVSVKMAVLLAVLALVPVTVIVEVLPVAAGPAVIVIVEEQVGLQDGDENVAVTFGGSGASEKVTGCVVPACSVAVTVVDPDAPPAVTVTLGLTFSA